MSNFTADIAAFAKKTESTLDEASRAIKLALFSGVIRDTRVRTGRLRGNWQTSTGRPISTTTERLDPAGASAIAEVSNNITGSGVDYMTNNLSYSKTWEQRDGMVARNMARIQRTVEEVARGKR